MNRREFMRFAAGIMALGAIPVWHAGPADGRDGIRYPSPLRWGDTIGITAPSAGVGPALEPRLEFCLQALQDLGFRIREGHCLHSDKMASAPAQTRADELQAMLLDDSIQAILPPWGGEILIDLLPLMDWVALAAARPKWIIGYSDLSTFMASYTLRTHIATLNGSNLLETPINPTDPALAHWTHVVALRRGSAFTQHAAARFQPEDVDWEQNPETTRFGRTAPVRYKCLHHEDEAGHRVTFQGRLIGGTLDVIAMLVGTAYGDIESFAAQCAPEGLILFLDDADMNTAQYSRLLQHLKLGGWFDRANGVLIGRTGAEQLREFTTREALLDALGDLKIPILYDVDAGHLPPQLMLVNGARAVINYERGYPHIGVRATFSIQQRLIP